MTLWMRVEMAKENIMVLDCGYLKDPRARKRADKVFAAGISKKNMSMELTGPRILILIPETKRSELVKKLKLSDKKSYFGATHCFPIMLTEKTFKKNGVIGG